MLAYICRSRGQNLKPFYGNSVALKLYAEAPHRASFIPTLVGMQLWRGRLRRDMLKQMARMGLSIGYDGTLAALDRIRKGYDKDALECKNILERQLAEAPIGEPLPHTAEDIDASFLLADMILNLDDEIEPREPDGK